MKKIPNWVKVGTDIWVLDYEPRSSELLPDLRPVKCTVTEIVHDSSLGSPYVKVTPRLRMHGPIGHNWVFAEQIHRKKRWATKKLLERIAKHLLYIGKHWVSFLEHFGKAGKNAKTSSARNFMKQQFRRTRKMIDRWFGPKE